MKFLKLGWPEFLCPPSGYRKFTLGALALVMSFVLCWRGIVTGEQWNIALGLVLGISGFGNVMEHREKRKEAQADADVAQSQADEAGSRADEAQTHADERAGR